VERCDWKERGRGIKIPSRETGRRRGKESRRKGDPLERKGGIRDGIFIGGGDSNRESNKVPFSGSAEKRRRVSLPKRHGSIEAELRQVRGHWGEGEGERKFLKTQVSLGDIGSDGRWEGGGIRRQKARSGGN